MEGDFSIVQRNEGVAVNRLDALVQIPARLHQYWRTQVICLCFFYGALFKYIAILWCPGLNSNKIFFGDNFTHSQCSAMKMVINISYKLPNKALYWSTIYGGHLWVSVNSLFIGMQFIGFWVGRNKCVTLLFLNTEFLGFETYKLLFYLRINIFQIFPFYHILIVKRWYISNFIQELDSLAK